MNDQKAKKIRLITNNPAKRVGLNGYGIDIVETVPIIIEPNDSDKTYTYDFSFSPLVYITLSNPKEDNFEEEVFEQECESTFKISIRFCKVIPNIGAGFRANSGGEKSDPITIVCYEDFKFFVGH